MRGWLKAALIGVVALDFLTPAGPLPIFTADSEARASSVPLVNPQQLQIPSIGIDLNAIITSINVILSPLTGGAGAGGVNQISLTSGATGLPAQIALQPGADANAALAIVPNGNGNIMLFGAPGQPGQPWASSSTGVLQFGNAAGFIKANGFAPCPGMATNRPPMLGIPATVVTGFFQVQDWLGFQYAVPACGNQFGASLRGSF